MKELDLDDPAIVVAVHIVEVMALFLVALLIRRIIVKYRHSVASSTDSLAAVAHDKALPNRASSDVLERMFLDTAHSADSAESALDLCQPQHTESATEQTTEPKQLSSSNISSPDSTLGHYIDAFFGQSPK